METQINSTKDLFKGRLKGNLLKVLIHLVGGVLFCALIVAVVYLFWYSNKIENDCNTDKNDLVSECDAKCDDCASGENQYDSNDTECICNDDDSLECPDCPDCNYPVNTCGETTYTSDEQATMTGWLKFENEIYGYTFRYPEDWIITDEITNVGLKDQAISTVFLNFYSDEATVREILYPLILLSDTTIELDCVTANKKEYKGDTTVNPTFEKLRVVVITYEVNEIPYRIEIGYEDQGASVTSDIVEMYSLILKTMRFE